MPDFLIEYNLEEILESIDIINQRLKDINKPDDFMITPFGTTLFDSIVMRLQTIGERIKNIDKKNANFLKRFTEVQWNDIIRLRDLISHHYENVNPTIVFDICNNKLPTLKIMIEKMLKEFKK